jgi:hypothetical protein
MNVPVGIRDMPDAARGSPGDELRGGVAFGIGAVPGLVWIGLAELAVRPSAALCGAADVRVGVGEPAQAATVTHTHANAAWTTAILVCMASSLGSPERTPFWGRCYPRPRGRQPLHAPASTARMPCRHLLSIRPWPPSAYSTGSRCHHPVNADPSLVRPPVAVELTVAS